jgi:hypothetical protein
MVRSRRSGGRGGVSVVTFLLALAVACDGGNRGAADDDGRSGAPSAGGTGGTGGSGGSGGVTGGSAGSAGKNSGSESGEGGDGAEPAGRGGAAGSAGSNGGAAGVAGSLGGAGMSGGTLGIGGAGAGGIGGATAGTSGAGNVAGAAGGSVGTCRDAVYDGKTYLVCPHQGLDWFAARMFCQARDMDLVSINTEPENLWAYTEDVEGGSIWIGASDGQSEGVWIWVDGEGLINGYTNWQASQPNDAELGEDCAVLHSGQGDWNDIDCAEVEFATGPISLICEPP